jgi:hypothetical protein
VPQRLIRFVNVECADVELAFEPSESFRFVRQCDWPTHLSAAEMRDVDAAMAAGVHDALLPSNGSPYDAMGVSAACVAVEWDNVGSSEMAFYIAAWRATRQLRESGEWDLVPV